MLDLYEILEKFPVSKGEMVLPILPLYQKEIHTMLCIIPKKFKKYR